MACNSHQVMFDVYVVLDFEATCDKSRRIHNQEIIEFPMVVVDARTATCVAEFQRYVRPVASPTLSAFCTELTGITQDVVDRADVFTHVFEEAKQFLCEQVGVGTAPPFRSVCIVTCGDWDLKIMLPNQLQLVRSTESRSPSLPRYFTYWANLKKVMTEVDAAVLGQWNGDEAGQRAVQKEKSGRRGPHDRPRINGMIDMLRALNLRGVGRPHSGIDDCRNISMVLCELLRRGVRVAPTYDELGTSEPIVPWLGTDAEGKELGAIAPGSIATTIVPEGQCPPPSQFDPRVIARERGNNDGGDEGRGSRNGDGRGRGCGVRGPEGRASGRTQATVPQRFHVRIIENMDPIEDYRDAISAVNINYRDGVSVSKALSRILRHAADNMGVSISDTGLVKMDDLLRLQPFRSLNMNAASIMHTVEKSDKKRFRVCYADDGKKTLYVGATQGHSLEGICPNLRRVVSAEEVDVAVHGTYWDAWSSILKCGYLSTMSRSHIHFAKGLVNDHTVISGMRKSVELFVYLDVAKTLRDGVELYESENGVILTPGVGTTRQLPLAYVKKVVDRSTGRIVYPIE